MLSLLVLLLLEHALCVDYFTVKEEQEPGAYVGNITRRAGFKYYFSETVEHFRINPDYGSIYTKTKLDRESLQETVFSLIVLSSAPVYATEVSIRIIDINDHAPKFRKSKVHIDIPESVSIGHLIPIEKANDPDLGKNSVSNYTIVSGNGENKFSLVVILTLLHLKVDHKLDSETRNGYKLNISAFDDGTPRLYGYTILNITVKDVNDNVPLFSPTKYKADVFENATVGTSILHLKATDQDSGINGHIRYSLSVFNGLSTNLFAIDRDSGLITLNGKLDFETTQSYEIEVLAKDGGSPSQTGKGTVSIMVKNVNDNKPTISVSQKNPVTLRENKDHLYAVFFTLKDKESGSAVTLSIISGNQDGRFVLSFFRQGSYFLRTTSKLDREQKESYVIVLRAYDSGSPQLTTDYTMHIFVEDENDNNPVFINKENHKSIIKEGVPVGTYVGDVKAIDLDAGDNGVVRYSILAGNYKDWFRITDFSGLITTNAQIDYDVLCKPFILLTVTASDRGAPSLHNNITFNVSVIHDNDNAPKFNQSLYIASIKETSPTKSIVLQLNATDLDCGPDGLVSYSFAYAPSAVQSQFQLDSQSGIITLKSMLDYLTHKLFSFYVIAMDSGTPPKYSKAEVRINVIDEDNHTPVFSADNYYISLLSEKSFGFITKLNAVDFDTGVFARIDYSIQTDSCCNYFTVDSVNGILTSTRILVAGNSYHVRLTASSNGKTSTVNVWITVVDSFRLKPVFTRDYYSFTVSENALGKYVGKITTEISNRFGVLCSFTSGNELKFFKINNQGEIFTSKAIDRELYDHFVLTVSVRTNLSLSLSTTATVKISVDDVNDNTPELTRQQLFDYSIKETTKIGEKVFSVHAADADFGNSGTISYTILQNSPVRYFEIDSITGIVYLVRSLMNVSTDIFNLDVEISDIGNPKRSLLPRFVVNLIDTNDHFPTPKVLQYTTVIKRNISVNTRFLRVVANDQDFGNNSKVSYRIINGNIGNTFGIFPSGWLYLKQLSLHSNTDYYVLSILASDHGQLVKSATINVNIFVQSQTVGKIFKKNIDTLFIAENKPANSFVANLSTNIIDGSRNIAFRFASPSSELFLGEKDGIMRTKMKLDRENIVLKTGVANLITLVTAERTTVGGIVTENCIFEVNVLDENDNGPSFGRLIYSAMISENAAPGTSILQVTATDLDSAPNSITTYEMSASNPIPFVLNPLTGFISVATKTPKTFLDYETYTRYNFTVTAKDAKNSSMFSSSKVFVYILDENDNKPVFKTTQTSFSISESTKIGTKVTTFQAEDKDSRMNSFVEYYLSTTPADTGIFEINKYSGEMHLMKALDFEAKSSYNLVITAKDLGTLSLHENLTVSVHVIDANDNKPAFKMDPMLISVNENIPVQSVIGMCSATDSDSEANGMVRFSIVEQGPVPNAFKVDQVNCDISTQVQINREMHGTFYVVVKAEDQAINPSERLSSTKNITINVLDLNDNSPVFLPPLGGGFVRQSTTGWSAIKITAEDPDKELNGTVVYTIKKGLDSACFSIDANTGLVTVTAPLSNTKKIFEFEITGSDRGPSSRQTTALIRLFVFGAAADAPTCSGTGQKNIDENIAVGTNVYQVTAVSAQSPSKMLYFIKSGNTNSAFKIDSTTGWISTRKLIDYESGINSYNLVVYAVENLGLTPMTVECSVHIRVVDLNDNAPEFIAVPAKVSVLENTTVGKELYQVFATDKDSGQNGIFTFTITTGDSLSVFRIDSNTGKLFLQKELDRENVPMYHLTIEARDKGIPTQQSTARLAVNVTDVNDNEPRFNKSYHFSIPERSPKNTVAGKIVAFDNDVGRNSEVYYKILDAEQDTFVIDHCSGVLSVARDIDHETIPNFVLDVKATDYGNPSMSTTSRVFINIIDQNDNCPVFVKEEIAATVQENLAAGVDVVNVSATDKDRGNYEKVMYRITQGNFEDSFSIDENGVISTKKMLDREKKATFDLLVSADNEDNKKKCFSYARVSIAVLDSNDNSPVLNQPHNVHIPESKMQGSVIHTFIATDIDSGANAKVVFSWVEPNIVSTVFTLAKNGSLILRSLLDYETVKQYSCQIILTDQGSPSSTSISNVTIFVVDVNDNNPIFNQHPQSISVMENTTIGTAITELTAFDSDFGENSRLSYSIVSGNLNSTFSIDEETGILILAKELDREKQTGYNLDIVVKDHGVPQRKGITSVQISVSDVNDFAPKFAMPIYSISFLENSPAQFLLRVIATDLDSDSNGAIRYSLMPSKESRFFTIDHVTGRISSTRQVDREVLPQAKLTIIATDQGTPSRSGKTTVVITVLDENDNSPIISPANSTTYIQENLNGDFLVQKLHIVDPDNGANSTLKVKLVNNFARFKIKQSGSEYSILTTRGLDREFFSDITLQVEVADEGSPKRSTIADVHVFVLDDNDSPPVLSKQRYDFRTQSNTAAGTFVAQVQATDSDLPANSKMQFSVISGNRSFVNVEQDTGIIYTKIPIPPNAIFQFDVQVSDPIKTHFKDTATVSISAATGYPVFTHGNSFKTLLESTPLNTVIETVHATSSAVGPAAKIMYFIKTGNTRSSFKVDANSGAVHVANALDYETTQIFSLWIEARDSQSPPLSSYVKIVITVKNENDSAPRIVSPTTNVTFQENQAASSLVTRVVAIDKDHPTSTVRLRFKLRPSTPAVPFTIDQNNGEIRSTARFNREATDNYSLDIIVYPVNKPLLETKLKLLVIIGDENDNKPVIHSPSEVTVSEGLEVNSEILVLNVTDDDIGVNGRVTFDLISDTFKIDKNTGTLTLIKKLDREVVDSYTLSISVKDPSLVTIFSLKVIVSDINDSPPYFTANPMNINVPEDTAVNDIFRFVKAADKDIGSNAFCLYYIEPRSGRGKFRIDSTSGALSLKAKVKYIKPSTNQMSDANTFQFILYARNLHYPFYLTSATLFIHVTDANDHPPVFSKNIYNAYVEATAPTGFVVTEVFAEDRFDSGLNAAVKYSVNGGNGSNVLFLDGTKVKVKDTLATYVNQVLSLTVTAEDSGQPKKFTTATVFARILKQNVHSPIFSQSNYITTIPENYQLFKEILRVIATDQDSGENGRVTFIVKSGLMNEIFAVGMTNGSVYAKKPLDFEKTSSYALVIEARDQSLANTRKATTNVQITLTDFNDNYPMFTSTSYKANVRENSPVNTQVIKVQATDADQTASTSIKYSIADATGRLFFTIDSNTGMIRTRTGIDYEKNTVLKVQVTATDNGNPLLLSLATVDVTVLGVNEFTPKFTQRSYNFAVSNQADTETIIGTVIATDLDKGLDGVVYYVPRFSSKLSLFTLDSLTGKIRVAKKLLIGNYILKIFVKNLLTSHITSSNIDEATVYIDVIKGNEPPVFTKSSYSMNIKEDKKISESVLTISATDNDAKPGGTVRYSITSQVARRAFSIDPVSGVISVNTVLDRETVPSYTLQVQATDNGVPPAANTTVVTINLIDVNDKKPKIVNCKGSVLENATKDTIVTKLVVADGDIDPNRGPFSFTVTSTADFIVTSNLGELKVNAALDRERTAFYNLSVDVSDNGAPKLTSRGYCEVTILDVSDVSPRIRNVSVIVNSLQRYFRGGLIGDLSPIDPDIVDKYICKMSNPSSRFSFEQSSCKLQAASQSSIGVVRLQYQATTHNANVSDNATLDFVPIIGASINNTLMFRLHGIQVTGQKFTDTTLSKVIRHFELISPVALVIRLLGYKQQKRGTLDLLVALQSRATYHVSSLSTLATLITTNIAQLKLITGSSSVEMPVKICIHPGICQNNGSCSELRQIEAYPTIWSSERMIFHAVTFEATFSCRCKAGFYGARCEKVISSCTPNPCRNDGICNENETPGPSTRPCTCKVGFTGKYCEDDVNECRLLPCKNNGNCVNTKGSYYCNCRPKYTGKECENIVDLCNPNPCLFGGTCVPTSESFACKCTYGNQGKFCEIHAMTFPELSYLSANSIANQALNITLDLATYDKQSLLLYGFHDTINGTQSPFIGLEIVNNYVRFSFNFGSQLRRLTIDAVKVGNGNWHRANVWLSRRVKFMLFVPRLQGFPKLLCPIFETAMGEM